jgi:hypothetical protein
VEEYFKGFTLRTSLRKTTEKKVSKVEKRQIWQTKNIQNPWGQRKKQLKNFSKMGQKPQELRRLLK